jgi:hypothetical protein
MKPVFGSLIVDGRGKLGDIVYSRNHYGPFTRVHFTPTNPATAYQVSARDLWRDVLQTWSIETDDTRKAWNLYAQSFKFRRAIGDKYTPSGFQMYVNCNVNRMLCGTGMLSTPESPRPYEDLLDFTLTSLGGNELTTIDNLAGQATSQMHSFIYATAGISQGITRAFRQYKLILVRSQDWGLSLNVATEWNARFPATSPGNRIFCKIKTVCPVSGYSYISKTAYVDTV